MTKIVIADVVSGLSDDPLWTDAEYAFRLRAENRAWWSANPRYGQDLEENAVWADRLSGIALEPISTTVPIADENNGPDSTPVMIGRNSDPAGGMATPDGVTVVPSGNFTFWSISKAGTTAQATLASIVGDNGGGYVLRQRSSNLVTVHPWTISGGLITLGSILLSQTLSSSAYALVQLQYNHALGQMSLYANGSLLSGGTPSGGVANVTLTFPSNRLSVLAPYDVDITFDTTQNGGRNLEIAEMGIAGTLVSNAAWQNALLAMLDEKYPSLNLL